MRFGMTIKPDMTVDRIVALTRQAEAAGFEYGWIFEAYIDGCEYEQDEAGAVRHQPGRA
jgi:hypothetical protein